MLITKEPKKLIRYIISHAFSNEEELGYDPSVKRGWHNNVINHTYTINERHFRTIGKPLDDCRVDIILTRATRIWRVREVSDEGDVILDADGKSREYALKDVWLSHDATLEKDILKDIRSKLHTAYTQYFPDAQEAGDAFDELFLTIEECDTVPSAYVKDEKGKCVPYSSEIYTCSRLLPDDEVLREYSSEQKLKYKSLSPVSSQKHGIQNAPAGHPLSPYPHLSSEVEIRRDRFEHKKHVRAVFREVVTNLYQAADIFEVFQAVLGVALGM